MVLLLLGGMSALDKLVGKIDGILVANVERRTHVERGGLDVEGVDEAVGGATACLFRDEGERCALVEEAELSVCVLPVGRVGVDSAVLERAVLVCDKGANVPCRDKNPIILIINLKIINKITNTLVPLDRIPLVNKIIFNNVRV